ncbi:calmodulin-lysine N-methyltransferase [Anastrepha ludens]|uniref:calmodulin-lysine N-methyltransferase n=1 Tax=Anastrepha ludens TaxID=28586 RepID=UPI0023AED39D|nr:calmodulin-lysine N-methyltransferase [Anastrepha ludens]XP_053958775.1 calmodulin-lysine N-methyltransferase [Anastrepha ludens]XP_053958776.1 calmodulin-lysine N-methyltransferase [Anastrepha ludens]XP_053958777.1 calmodulin-lysine N-methyltransferase [Anastrepha ludens]XP_053958778.1 calmodulin-lysine N-methyltransferase [Anastrepha ludens]
MSTSVQNFNKPATVVDCTAVILPTAVASSSAIQQLSSISLMLEYDIDNTLNTIKESGTHLIHQQQQHQKNINQLPAIHIKRQSATTTAAKDATATTQHGDNITSEDLKDIKPVLPPTPPATPNLTNTARKRWKILAKVLRKDSEETVSSSGEEFGEEQTASVRRFKSFDLLRQDSFEDHMTLNCLGKPENWYKYSVLLDGDGQQEFTVNIHHVERQLTASDLMGFNNTGNICVWPSEEALTAYVLSNVGAYSDKWILELGGGFTCLAGLMLSKYAKPYAVHLTDGNEVSVENVKKTVCLNELSCYTKCSVLKWEDVEARVAAEAGKFDVILSADCLFFDEARSSLVGTIWYYLAPRGEAVIMAPRRGKTMAMFVGECTRRGFEVDIAQRYNDTIWKRHEDLMTSSELYDEDLHYPVLLRLRKSIINTFD